MSCWVKVKASGIDFVFLNIVFLKIVSICAIKKS